MVRSCEKILVANRAFITHALDKPQLHVGVLILLLGFFDPGFRGWNFFRPRRTQQLVELRLSHR